MQSSSSKKENFLRPIFGDRIQYFLIGVRPQSIGYEIPEIFISRCLQSMTFLPKSILQIFDPLNWHLENIKNHISCHIDFGVFFDDYSVEDYDFLFNVPCKLMVLFLNTKNEEIFQKIESLDRFFLITSDDKQVYDKLESSDVLKAKTFCSQITLLNKIFDFAAHEFNLSPKKLKTLQQKRFKKSEEILRDLNFNSVPNFAPASVNITNLYQLLCLDKPNLLQTRKSVKPEKRIEDLLEISLALGIIGLSIKEVIPDALPFPTIIFVYPFFNPDYRELVKQTIDEVQGDDQSKAKLMRQLRFTEQDINTYDYTVDLKSSSKSETMSDELQSVLFTKQSHIRFLDFVSYLHSTFELSPYIRVPARGVSLNECVNRLSPSQYKKTQNNRSLKKNITQIGKNLAANLPAEVVNFLGKYANGIFAISDLPIEWIPVQDDVPLAFLCDVCRVPETALTSVFSQFNANCRQFFKIQKNILKKTLVICGATSGDPIFTHYQNNLDLKNKQDNLHYKTAHIQSKKEFFEIINEVRPHLLIIDSHGNFKTKSEGSYISIGNEKLTGDDIVENLPQIPLVILSCCWGTPIYGNSNTIAQAFFEKGSFSVLSTFLPISVNRGLILYSRILNNLSYAAKYGVHENWMNFVSHNIRTAYFHDLLIPVLEKFGVEVFENEKYSKLCSEWIAKSLCRESRYTAYKQVQETILKCVKDSYKTKVERLLKNNEAISEFMLYTHLGRGDLIKFDSWIKKS